MAPEAKNKELVKFINELASNGRYTFSFAQFSDFASSPEDSVRQMLSRGLKRKQIVSPAKGFYVVIPPEYQALGSLEASEFIPHLMAYWQEDYYVSLLSAAAVHGAAHHAPMSFQIMAMRHHKAIKMGRVSIKFYQSRYVGKLPIIKKNTRKSILQVASPETTAFDLISHFRNAGGFSNVVTVLSELVESLQSKGLQQVSKSIHEIVYSQRLGYILDSLGYSQKTSGLLKEVQERAKYYTAIVPYKNNENATRNEKWLVIENEAVESEI